MTEAELQKRYKKALVIAEEWKQPLVKILSK
jgi:hypothetical protein